MAKRGKVLVGISSWTEPTLVKAGTFYPKEAKSAEERLRKARELLLKNIPQFEGLPRVVRAAFEDALVRYVEQIAPNVADAQLAKLAGTLWGLMRQPLRVRGFRRDLDPATHSQYRSPEFTDYAVAMLHALTLAMPKPGSFTVTTKPKGAK